MGCDIHSQAERRVGGAWKKFQDYEPFDWRSYGMFAFLAGVRNYSAITPISEPRGIPDDADIEMQRDVGDHSYSWLSVDELLSFDYDAKMKDRRVRRQIAENVWSGAVTCEPGEGAMMTYREFLGPAFFEELDKLKNMGAERIVFGFDS